MEIICHRGYWNTKNEQNSLKAFERALCRGFGVEFDVRNYGKKLVVSHDIDENF